MIHSVNTKYIDGMSFVSEVQGFEVPMDVTTEEGGDSSAPSPKRLMLTSLAGCTGMDVVSILKKMKVHFSNFSIAVDASLTNEHPKIYNDVTIIYKIKIDTTDKEKMEKAVLLSQDKYCGVSAMFKAFAKVTYRIEYL